VAVVGLDVPLELLILAELLVTLSELAAMRWLLVEGGASALVSSTGNSSVLKHGGLTLSRGL